MTGDELYALGGELVGHRNSLLRVAGVIAHFQDELLAIDAAGGVDVGHRHLGAALHLLTEGRVLAGDRAGHGDRDIGPGRGGGESRREAYG